MKRLIYILAIVLLTGFAKAEAQNMRTIFVEMPDSIVPLLTATNRADCADFIEAGMKARVTNRLDGYSELAKLTQDYLHMKMTAHTDLQMKLLPATNSDTIICMINTVRAEAADSRVRFFTKKWEELTPRTRFFASPAIKDFFTPDADLDKRLLIADIYLVELLLSAESTTLQATYTMPAYLSQEDSLFISKNIQSINYIWENGKFVRKATIE